MPFSSVDDYWKFRKAVWDSGDGPLPTEAKDFLVSIRQSYKPRIKPIGKCARFYRAQFGTKEVEYDDNPQTVGLDEDRLVPKVEYINAGRANMAGQVFLYLATSELTAISEMRPWLSQDVSVAIFVVQRDLRVVDLSVGHDEQSYEFSQLMNTPLSEWDKPRPRPDQETIDKHVWFEIDKAFSAPVTNEKDRERYYKPTQRIAELFRSEGLDGIVYKSQFGAEKGYNVALFNVVDASLVACTPFQVNKISIEYSQLGNTWSRGRK